jgi:UDP-N-acetyl-2-amino-2-deoxyglucuronate dehydrogenase
MHDLYSCVNENSSLQAVFNSWGSMQVEHPMSGSRVKFGIVGCGTIADFHARAISECKNAEIIGVCDVVEEHAREFSESHGIRKVFHDVRLLAEDTEVEAVCVCTPSGCHLGPSLTCIEAGKHILVEKPLEITTKRIDRIIECAKKNNVKVGAVFQLRFSPDPQKVKRAIQSGAFGKILIADAYVKYYRPQEYYDRAEWRGTWAVDGGGALINQSIHYIDLLLWFAGEVESVTGCCRTLAHKLEVEDTAHALLTFKSGAAGCIEGTTCAYPGLPSRIEIHGEKGTVCLEDDRLVRWNIMGDESPFIGSQSDERGYADPKAISVRGHVRQIEDMVQAILEDRAPVIDASEGRRSVALIEAIYRSSKHGKPCRM